MNMVSSLVGLGIMGASFPMMSQVAITPLIANKKMVNFSVAEVMAVTFVAQNEGQMSMTEVPDDCTLNDLGNNAYQITCSHGEGSYRQSVSRSFREGSDAQESRTYPYPTPTSYTHYHCPHHDPWGVVYFNETHLGGQNCVPVPLQSSHNFNQWDEEDWLWDISSYGL